MGQAERAHVLDCTSVDGLCGGELLPRPEERAATSLAEKYAAILNGVQRL